MILSIVGSLARLRKRQTLAMEPFSSKSCLKNLAVSMLTPMAANTMAKLSSPAPSAVTGASIRDPPDDLAGCKERFTHH